MLAKILESEDQAKLETPLFDDPLRGIDNPTSTFLKSVPSNLALPSQAFRRHASCKQQFSKVEPENSPPRKPTLSLAS